MFLVGENKQLKAASVIQDTKENIVKHVSTWTVLEKVLLKTKVTENPAGCYLNSNPVRVFLKIQVMLSIINGVIKLKLFPYGSNVRVQGSWINTI